MNISQNMIIDNQTGKIITKNIDVCIYNSQTGKYEIKFKNGKIYFYNTSRITWLKNPKNYDPSLYQISHLGKSLFEIEAIYVFGDDIQKYWHICFNNGSERDYPEQELDIEKSCLDNIASKNVFEYLKRMASEVSLKTEDGIKLLSKQYEKISSFIGEDTALASYLNPQTFRSITKEDSTPIFPFGSNASQFRAVKTALENPISIIQGPPGTGKTQTILNIIANLLIAGKTIQVVSNNNSATNNVLEKLASPQYGLDFLVAPLGNSKNKEKFIQNQSGYYPDLSKWDSELPEDSNFISTIHDRSVELKNIFRTQERLALAKQQLQELFVEQQHFEQHLAETYEHLLPCKIRKKLTSKQLMNLCQECQNLPDTKKNLPFFLKIKIYVIYGIRDLSLYQVERSKTIVRLQGLFYQIRIKELESEIAELEKTLTLQNAEKLSEEFRELSMKFLKKNLYKKYGKKTIRRKFTEDDLWKNPIEVQKEYPVVLSTTFSSRSSLCKSAKYDYLIMDEASQIDVATGALALSCAKNAVIVGDTKQLPNVVTDDIAKRTDAIFDSYNISESYCFSKKSFLQSVCELFPNAPQTLLREHYRCHPKIINFCNQKFYGGELVIMSSDHGEDNVLSVIKTVIGDHARDHVNQRQIDSVKTEVLPQFQYPPEEIGIIAPYNNQVEAMQKELCETGIDIATVHKFQGREKDAIILTTVDNVVTDFTDNPYLLNVAVSRAKKQLCLVVSGNAQPTDSNINDLISYIEYNNFRVTESKIYSVFDYLYTQYTEARLMFLKKHRRISEYDSENLMYALIKETFSEMNLLSLNVVCHQPLNTLIRDPILLSEEECRYAMNSATHLDFLIYSRVSKKPVLAIEVDGFHYHKEGTRQSERDKMKDHILELYEIPFLRFATNGSGEKEKLIQKLNEILS